ncbi:MULTISPECIES: DUF3558 domain-containing protein [unclassified Saccharopolyspora]|uniref:DUF3558 domain-containing protein n=1 Tax=unclassified Saccharopolyspora TaxID=2646250 RepID=UPI001CD77173|nr:MULTISPECIES: DUF3558 domain-containing protein [unclassified Saccharopolyspora]MCA1189412.1 DUF3558 domain-containing protein [Saccharopolyspora sp. 6T]MCA1282669.1 DUF3558 domain-containing protein [Saccharopolyspora sp. 7B]
MVLRSRSSRLLICVASVAALALSGCSVGSGEESAPSPSSAPDSGDSEVEDPRDAAGVPPCSLVKPQDIAALGLLPEGEVQPDELDPSLPDNCTWKSDRGDKYVAISVLPGRSLQIYRDNEDSYVDYSEGVIAGHPAIQANNDRPENGSCGVYLATKEDQILFSFAADVTVGEVHDPCSLAKRALEASVPTLPAAE